MIYLIIGGSAVFTKEGNREQGTGNREQGTDKKQKLLSLKLSQKKDVSTRCVARKKQCHYFNLMFLNMSFSCSL
jgi:hypothetical protein